MNGTLYYNKSDNIVINKTLSNDTSVSLHFKDDSEIVNPTIYLSRSIDMSEFNYLYVGGNVKRYYYIKKYTLSQQRYIVECEIDVLMSFKNDIYNLECIIERNRDKWNLYLNDDELEIYNIERVLTFPFPSGFRDFYNSSKSSAFVLALSGSGEPPTN